MGEVQLPGDDAEVRDPPRPVMPVGDSEASGYCELSGSGAPVWSCGIVSLGNTPACEKGYSGTPTSSGCI